MATPTTAAISADAIAFSDIDSDVIRTDILSRLDGPDLMALSCVSSNLHRLAARRDLWSTIVSSTWPSTSHHNALDLQTLINSFPNGPFSFFSQSFPLLSTTTTTTDHHQSTASSSPPPPPPNDHHRNLDRIISAVDISYRGKNIFSRVQETTGMESGWFLSSPFRIDLIEPRDGAVPTSIRKKAADEETCKDLYGETTLSWIMIDPDRKRAVNLSSFRPVSVQRRWWSGEVVVRFGAFIGCHVMCCIEVTCAGKGGEEGEEEELEVREVSMRVEDVDGAHLRGEDSLVILERAFGGKRVNYGKDEGQNRKYKEFMGMRRQRREKRMRREGRLDLLCVSFAVTVFIAFFVLLVLGR